MSGAFRITPHRPTSPRGRAWLAAHRALQRYDTEAELIRTRHKRRMQQLSLAFSQQASQAELAGYYDLMSHLTGYKINSEIAQQSLVARRIKRYEELTGYKIGSKEFEDAIDRTIENM